MNIKQMAMNAILLFIIFSQTGYAQYREMDKARLCHSNTLEINNIYAQFNDMGSLRGKNRCNAGIIWAPGDSWKQNPWESGIVYDHGLMIMGKIQGELFFTGVNWFNTFSAGPIIDGEAAMIIAPEDSNRYRTYKITRDDYESEDYLSWPTEFGAPGFQGAPLLKGDQALWTVYNANDKNATDFLASFNTPWLTNPVPIEIHQYVFGKLGRDTSLTDLYSNVIFLEWTIINKGDQSLDSTYISFWTDIDILEVHENPQGVDSTLQTGYCYGPQNAEFSQFIFPAVGYTLLYGPIAYAPGESGVFKGRTIKDYINTGLSSFHPIIDDGPHPPIGLMAAPMSMQDSWNFMRGLDINGDDIIDPTTNRPTKFTYSGIPETMEGWIYPDNRSGGGAGFMMNTGPLTIAPMDTQWMMIALVPALGNSNMDSIVKLREKAALLRSTPYDSLTKSSTHDLFPPEKEIVYDFKLYQNYPNPFNPATRFSYTIEDATHVRLEIYNMNGQLVEILVDAYQPAGPYTVRWDAGQISSGVLFYKLVAGKYTEIRKCLLLR